MRSYSPFQTRTCNRDGFAIINTLALLQFKLQRFTHSSPSKTFAFPEENAKSMNHDDGYVKLLKISANNRELRSGRVVHAHMIRAETNKNVIGVNCLVNFYAKCGRIAVARQLFDEMPQRNVVSWSSMIAGYSQNGLAEEALFLFAAMNVGDVRPNHFVFAIVFGSCSEIRALEQGKQCHGHVLKSGLVFYSYVGNALLSMYCRCSALDEAMRVFQTMPISNTLSCNAMISGFLMNGFDKEALKVLGFMAKDSIVWDHVTYVTALNLCAKLKDLRFGLQVHGQLILRSEADLNVYVGSAIIDMYGKCGMVFNARKSLGRLCDRNVVSWTSMMAAYAQNGLFEEALNLFLEMGLDGFRPNEFTYAVMLNSCAGTSALKLGYQLHCHAEKGGLRAHLLVGNALINMYSKSGSIEDACQVFYGMDWRDVVSWNSMISGFSHHGLGIEALQVFQEMQMEEVPNYVTFVGVLSACGLLGLVDDGFYYLNYLMKELGIKPGIEHYTCIVVLLSRAGLLDHAEKFMRSMPIRWDVVAWRTLLNACQIHGNTSLGTMVADVILRLYPDDAGTYILLSNVYARARKWVEVAKIRSLMKGREIKKEPGVSWIQVKDSTHIFVLQDRSHIESDKIYDKLAQLLAETKAVGYIPEISSVLHDVEDEQKEEYLVYHSEKLAIAFGLIKMPFGAPIHVIKNLRMCLDCHTFAKSISIVADRKIIVRDVNRFHCFKSGICSCGDYW